MSVFVIVAVVILVIAFAAHIVVSRRIAAARHEAQRIRAHRGVLTNRKDDKR